MVCDVRVPNVTAEVKGWVFGTLELNPDFLAAEGSIYLILVEL